MIYSNTAGNNIRACCSSTAYIRRWRSGSIRICQTERQNWNCYTSTQHRPGNRCILVQSGYQHIFTVAVSTFGPSISEV